MSDKFRILMTQAEIAALVGISQAAVSKYINGDSVPMPDTAVKLEEATGICREAWIWPERHWNPYQPFAEAGVCNHCTNRTNRIGRAMKMALERFRQSENKRAAFSELAQIGAVMSGYSKHTALIFREIREDGLYLLGATGSVKEFPEAPSPVLSGYHLALAKNGVTVFSYPYPHNLPDDGSEKFKEAVMYGKRLGLKSLLVVSKGRVTFASINWDTGIDYDANSIARTEEMIAKIDHIWKESGYQ